VSVSFGKSFLSQPKPFYLVFALELWERFGYYGVQALLLLYLVQGLRFSDKEAYFLLAAFSAIVFLLPVVGGYVGDNILGTKRTILLGSIVLAIGYLLLSLPGISNTHLLFPLAVIAVGNGLFKANPSTLLSKVYEGTGANFDSGFTLYYMAINIGALISMNLTPILNKYFGWYVAFFVCFIGLVLAILSYVVMRHFVVNYGSKPDHSRVRLDYLLCVLIGIVAVVGLTYAFLAFNQISSWLLGGGVLTSVIVFFILMAKADREERGGMFLFFILFCQSIIFFILYNQMPSSLTLFALRNVHHSILGFIRLEPAQFQMLNSLWIVLASPVLAALYQRQQLVNNDWSMPAKFSFGTLLAGLSFLVLPIGLALNHTTGIVSGNWLVLSYGLQSVGELFVSALGLSLVARYIPTRYTGFTMGLWLISTSIAGILGGQVAALGSVPAGISNDPILSAPIYSSLFLKIGVVTTIIAVIMFAFVPALKKIRVKDKQ
jgi:POT family proton-dependent oligopeptide transporter